LVNWKFWENWKFREHPQTQKTILQVQIGTLTNTKTVYVEAPTPEKALELMRELQKKEAEK